jgi:hypothetical protein
MGTKRLAKSRRKAAKGKGKGKGKGPGGRTAGGGRVAPKGKAPLRLPNLDPAGLGKQGGVPGLGKGGLPDLSDLGLGEGLPER